MNDAVRFEKFLSLFKRDECENNQNFAGIYLDRARKLSRVFESIPYVKMVAVCNTVAFGHAKRDSDIDLFIVCEKDRLLIGRLLTVIYLHLLGVRRHSKKIAGRFCLSFFIAEDSLSLKEIKCDKDDAYLAYWTATLIPVYGFSIFNEFKKNNEWAFKYVGDISHLISPAQSFEDNTKYNGNIKISLSRKFIEFLLKGMLGDWIENRIFNWQKKRFEARKFTSSASVIVNKKMLKFHNVDRRKQYNDEFEHLLKSF